MVIIGITGNIASGKTTVARLLKQSTKGIIIDADEVSREVTKPHSATWERIVKLFGREILHPKTNELNREKIASRVFKEPEKLKKLEQLTHPAIVRNIKQKINLVDRRAPQSIIIIEATKLLDSTLANLIDFALVVKTQRENQFTRLIKQKDYTMAQALARIETYTTPLKHAKIKAIVENNGNLEELKEQVQTTAKKIINS